MLATSDNNTAELLVKELGAVAGTGGTRDAGLEVVRQTLRVMGIATTGLVVADGSGLSNDNRVTCDALIAVLGAARPTTRSAPASPWPAGRGRCPTS